MKMDYCNTRGVIRDIDQVISQLNIIKEIITYKHRLPWHDIEQRIIALCKMDPSVHGITVKLIFKSRDEVDETKLSTIPIYIQDYGKAI
ncbi:hypothetical protein [Arenibacter palladensis]|uniref:hypothetical protein n=1 Tax=Arenibacter palladensis TaxID=237373 RepID=UPI0026E42599|nr:hypothetical protein [Arenibacter palladensis]MDO6604697.1 hypothetical protein [Arenibacter palladensis]